MKVVYLGTGAAEGIPALFCRCPYCTQARAQGGSMIRTRAQVILDGELSVDFPPDAFYHSALLGADLSAVKYLLVTHGHMDHFNASALVLRGYKYAHDMASPDLDLYCNEEVAQIYREATRRELKAEVAAHLRVHTVRAGEEFRFGAWRAIALRAQHTSRDPLVYYLEKRGKGVLHLCDTGTLPAESLARLSEAALPPLRLVTLDCTFLLGTTAPTARHMGLDENERVRDALMGAGLADANTQFVLTHFSHNSAPTAQTLEEAARRGFLAAYDGMTVGI